MPARSDNELMGNDTGGWPGIEGRRRRRQCAKAVGRQRREGIAGPNRPKLERRRAARGLKNQSRLAQNGRQDEHQAARDEKPPHTQPSHRQ